MTINGALASLAMIEGMGRGCRAGYCSRCAHRFSECWPVSAPCEMAQAAPIGRPIGSGAIIEPSAVTDSGVGSSLDNIETVCEEAEGGYLISRRNILSHAPSRTFLILPPSRRPWAACFTVFSCSFVHGGLAGYKRCSNIGLPGRRWAMSF